MKPFIRSRQILILLTGFFLTLWPIGCSKQSTEKTPVDRKFLSAEPARNTNLIEVEIKGASENTDPLPVDVPDLLKAAKTSHDVRIENGKAYITVFQTIGDPGLATPLTPSVSEAQKTSRQNNPNYYTIIMSEKDWNDMQQNAQE